MYDYADVWYCTVCDGYFWVPEWSYNWHYAGPFWSYRAAEEDAYCLGYLADYYDW